MKCIIGDIIVLPEPLIDDDLGLFCGGEPFGVEFVFALLSVNCISSPWVKKELEVALNQEICGTKVKVVPIILDDCRVPSFLSPKAYADLRKPRNYNQVMELIESLLEE